MLEDVIGCLSLNEVHVFKIKLVDCSDEKNMRSISVYSFSSESDSSSIDPWTGNELINILIVDKKIVKIFRLLTI